MTSRHPESATWRGALSRLALAACALLVAAFAPMAAARSLVADCSHDPDSCALAAKSGYELAAFHRIVIVLGAKRGVPARWQHEIGDSLR